MMLPRVHYKCDKLDAPPKKMENGYLEPKEYIQTDKEESNLVTSKLDYLKGNLHAPAFDVDFPVECYESSTPGHYHILIDVPMPWWKYRLLMWWMAKCGILEKGYYKASVARKASYLRKKGVKKKKYTGAPSTFTIEGNPLIIPETSFTFETVGVNFTPNFNGLASLQAQAPEEEGELQEEGETVVDQNIEVEQQLWQHWT
jgi:hypothetical protein